METGVLGWSPTCSKPNSCLSGLYFSVSVEDLPAVQAALFTFALQHLRGESTHVNSL